MNDIEFVRLSLNLHLYFARDMKEHAFIVEAGFAPKEQNLIRQAANFRREFSDILRRTVSLADGILAPDILQSGEIVTPYTLKAEMITTYLTGIQIETQITQEEERLTSGELTNVSPALLQNIISLNQRAMNATTEFIKLNADILSRVTTCNIFTISYPLLLEHMLNEADLYLLLTDRIQNRVELFLEQETAELEFFWNVQMAEHAKIFRGLLDPTETGLISIANDFATTYDQLTAEAQLTRDGLVSISDVMYRSLEATKNLQYYNTQIVQELLGCEIKSIIIPLLVDHALRETNYLMRLLNDFIAIYG